MGPIRFPLAALTLFCAAQAEAKTLVYCFESDPATLSAVLAVSGADMVASAHQMFDSLTAMNSAMTEIEPGFTHEIVSVAQPAWGRRAAVWIRTFL